MATPKKSTRATRTAAQTSAEFTEVQEAAASSRALSPGEKAVAAQRESVLRNNVATFSLEKVLQGLTSTGLDLTKAVTNISENLQQAAQQVTELNEAKELLLKDIDALHGKEVAASAIEDLIASFNTKETELNEHFAALKKDLERTAQENREAWAREQQTHIQAVQFRDSSVAETRRREEEQYTFNKTEERRRNELAWQNQMADHKRAEAIRQAELQRGWDARETELKAKEQLLVELQTRVNGIQGEIDAAVKKAEAIVGSAVKRDYEHQIQILTAAQNAEKTVMNNKLDSLTAQLANAMATIQDLQQKLASANDKASEIAKEALTAASGRQALAEVQGLLQTQGNGTTARKQ